MELESSIIKMVAFTKANGNKIRCVVMGNYFINPEKLLMMGNGKMINLPDLVSFIMSLRINWKNPLIILILMK